MILLPPVLPVLPKDEECTTRRLDDCFHIVFMLPMGDRENAPTPRPSSILPRELVDGDSPFSTMTNSPSSEFWG